MEPEEVDSQIEELENRLERLRSLYEQYFLGIEKIEPAVARKDVDRRIWQLRREQIRNTARRFRFQVIVQRYNTFQQYWQRICREIENGTYKRHMLRAERSSNALTIAARKRLGHFARDRGDPADPPEQPSPPAGEGDRGLEAEQPAPSPTPPQQVVPPTAGSAARRRPAAPAEPIERLELDLDFGGGTALATSPDRPRPAADAVALAASPQPKTRSPAVPPPPPLRTSPQNASQPAPRPPRREGAAPSPALSEERVRQLHARLIDAKRQVNDSRTISVDGLKQRLAAAETKLRQQHGNRRIDFDVVIRNGKALVKPILR